MKTIIFNYSRESGLENEIADLKAKIAELEQAWLNAEGKIEEQKSIIADQAFEIEDYKVLLKESREEELRAYDHGFRVGWAHALKIVSGDRAC